MAFAGPILAIASIASGVIGAGVSAYGAMQQGAAAQASANYQAQIAKNNQTIAQNNANYERQKGDIDAQQQDYKNKQIMGQLTAQMGASGLDIDSDSFRNLRQSQAQIAKMDSLTIKGDSERKAINYINQGKNFGAEAELDKMTGENAATAGGINAFGSLIGGVSSVGDKWMNFKQAGVWG